MNWNDDDWNDRAWEALFDSEPFSNKQSSRTQKENTEMINLQRSQTPTETNVQKGVQFLKPQHVPVVSGKVGELKAKIYKVTTDKPDGFGNPVVVYFATAGQKYSKSFKLTSDNLAALVGLFGADETKWSGKAVTISKNVTEDGERLTFGK